MAKKPKASENKARNVETSARRKVLEQELGKLTYEIAKLQKTGNALVKRGNEIGVILEQLDGKK